MEDKQILKEIQSLKASKGWELVRSMVQHELDAKMEELLTIDQGKNAVEYTAHDIIRSEVAFLKMFRDAPDAISTQYDAVIESDPEI